MSALQSPRPRDDVPEDRAALLEMFERAFDQCRHAEDATAAGNFYVSILAISAEIRKAIETEYTPEGYVLVPVEPTEGMWEAAMRLRTDDNAHDPDYSEVYQAMLSAHAKQKGQS